MIALAFAAALVGASETLPALPEPCRLTVVAPWVSAGEGYTVQAITDGEDCAAASLMLALVSPAGRALREWQWSATVAVRRFYGVPGPAEMKAELEAWIAPAEGKPDRTSLLPVWPEGASTPEGFEPAEKMTPPSWNGLRDADLALFCFDDAPGFQPCAVMDRDEAILDIGRRATR